MLLSAAMIQIGAKPVAPTQPVKVEEEANMVIRALVYRDEHDEPWDNVVKGPVKCLLQHASFAHIKTDEVMDVWDRQFLDEAFAKCQPPKAAVFSVLLRLPSAQPKALVADSGVSSVYCEPRSESGREPHADFKVVWTPKKSKQQIQILRSQMGGKSDLVRSGNTPSFDESSASPRVDISCCLELQWLPKPSRSEESVASTSE